MKLHHDGTCPVGVSCVADRLGLCWIDHGWGRFSFAIRYLFRIIRYDCKFHPQMGYLLDWLAMQIGLVDFFSGFGRMKTNNKSCLVVEVSKTIGLVNDVTPGPNVSIYTRHSFWRFLVQILGMNLTRI